ncbi:MAG: SDR family NAD(P)-dependent oxidoreductase [Rubripirellula sp.]
MSEAFRGTAAVVTGASSGIGREIAVALASRGVERLVVHFRANEAGAEETASKVRQYGCVPTLIAADLSDAESRESLVEQSFESLGAIHTWINNAGADVLTGDRASQGFEDKLRHLMEVDVLGTVSLARAVMLRLERQTTSKPPVMIFTGWDQAPLGMEGDAGQMFGPTKAAVMAFANSLAQSVAPRVRVNTVAPGWIQTSWGESTSDYWDQRAKGQALMQRWGTPRDVADAVLYLADPSATFVTGQTLEVNGGFSRHH